MTFASSILPTTTPTGSERVRRLFGDRVFHVYCPWDLPGAVRRFLRATEPELLLFEQHLYLRQPGYGTSYVTGKYLLERTLADWAKQGEERGEAFSLREFFDALNATDSIPIALSRWEMTGLSDEIPGLAESD